MVCLLVNVCIYTKDVATTLPPYSLQSTLQIFGIVNKNIDIKKKENELGTSIYAR